MQFAERAFSRLLHARDRNNRLMDPRATLRGREVYLDKWFMLFIGWLLIVSEVISRDANVSANSQSIRSFPPSLPGEDIQDNFVIVLWYWSRVVKPGIKRPEDQISWNAPYKEIRCDKLVVDCYKLDPIFVFPRDDASCPTQLPWQPPSSGEKRRPRFSSRPYSAAYSRIFSAEISKTSCSSRDIAYVNTPDERNGVPFVDNET